MNELEKDHLEDTTHQLVIMVSDKKIFKMSLRRLLWKVLYRMNCLSFNQRITKEYLCKQHLLCGFKAITDDGKRMTTADVG